MTSVRLGRKRRFVLLFGVADVVANHGALAGQFADTRHKLILVCHRAATGRKRAAGRKPKGRGERPHRPLNLDAGYGWDRAGVKPGIGAGRRVSAFARGRRLAAHWLQNPAEGHREGVMSSQISETELYAPIKAFPRGAGLRGQGRGSGRRTVVALRDGAPPVIVEAQDRLPRWPCSTRASRGCRSATTSISRVPSRDGATLPARACRKHTAGAAVWGWG